MVLAKLPIGEDIAANAPAGKTADITLRLRFPAVNGEYLRITLNGQIIGTAESEAALGVTSAPAWFSLNVHPSELRVGMNYVHIDFHTLRATTQTVELDRLEFVVDYK